jgi:hypothetical protein
MLKAKKSFCVAVRRIHNQFSNMRIDCAKNGFSFALALSPADFGLFTFLRPGAYETIAILGSKVSSSKSITLPMLRARSFLLPKRPLPYLRFQEKTLSFLKTQINGVQNVVYL